MESTRQKKISRLLQKELAIIFQKEAPSLLGNFMYTVTTIRVSSDLSVAKVFLSIFPSKESHEVIRQAKKKAPFFRNLLARKVRYQLRVIPELHIFLDDSADYTDEIDRLLK